VEMKINSVVGRGTQIVLDFRKVKDE